jgi:hypothetical protein
MEYGITTIKFPFLLSCITLFLIQAYEQVNLYLKKDIFSTTSIENLEEGHMVLVFCRNPPVLDYDLNVTELQELIIRPISSKIKMKKILTLYKENCQNFSQYFYLTAILERFPLICL